MPHRAAEPAGAVALDPLDHRAGQRVGRRVDAGAVGRGVEAHERLVEHDVVEDLDAGPRAEPFGDAPGERAAALDHRRDAGAAERTQRRIDRHAARPARRFGHPVEAVARDTLGTHQIAAGDRHGGAVRGPVGDEDEARVIGHVEPFVAVGGDRIGALDTGDEMAQRGRGGGP